MEVIIIANGEVTGLGDLLSRFPKDTYIICADGAARHLVNLGLTPSLLVGDFDSIALEDLEWMKERAVELRQFPAKKDFTDSELALEYALELKPNGITIIGGIGSRWDHSLSNILFLDRLHGLGIKGRLIDAKGQLTITDNLIELEGEPGEIVSIIPLTEAVEGVTLKGLEYPLTNHYIPRGSSLGISNRLLGNQATISLKKGTLLVFQGREY